MSLWCDLDSAFLPTAIVTRYTISMAHHTETLGQAGWEPLRSGLSRTENSTLRIKTQAFLYLFTNQWSVVLLRPLLEVSSTDITPKEWYKDKLFENNS